MRQRLLRPLSILFLLTGLGICGGAQGATSPVLEASRPDSTKEIVITPVDNKMKYATTEFVVEPGQTVHLILKNTATSPSMRHNVVVLRTDEASTVKKVAQAGSSAGPSNDYVPDHEALLASTPLSKPGATVEVTFTAPDTSGEYAYLCTFPGHWSTMQGTMQVK